jgi:hypothetical protein
VCVSNLYSSISIFSVKPNNKGQQISLKASSSDRIQLFLEQVDVPSGVSEYYGYKITYGNDDKNQYINHDDKKTTITVTLTGLNYNTEYQLKVEPYRIMKGVYDNGDGYPMKTFKTKCAGKLLCLTF